MSLFTAIALLAAAPIAGDDPDSIIVTGTPLTREEASARPNMCAAPGSCSSNRSRDG